MRLPNGRGPHGEVLTVEQAFVQSQAFAERFLDADGLPLAKDPRRSGIAPDPVPADPNALVIEKSGEPSP